MHLLRPRYFFLGTFLGFLLCCITGIYVSKNARYNHFIRFHNYISPIIDYYPTASELLATAKHDIDPNRITVLIGGSSLLRGDGQNEDDLWSQKLQKILGQNYKVLNYGFNSAQFASFGGVAFRILSEHYPNLIFISSCTFAGEEKNIDGGDLHGYLFWDAYYKKLFHPEPNVQLKIDALRKNQLLTSKGIELHIMTYLDSFFYFRNLWNWVSYRFVFTIWNKNAYPKTFQARRRFQDDIIDNTSLAKSTRNNNERFNSEVAALLSMAYHNLVNTRSKHLVANKESELRDTYNNIFEAHYRGNMLCLLSRYNVRHLKSLPKIEQESYEIIMNDTQSIIQSLGYHAIQLKGMTPNDYIDMMHYVASGGNKIAYQVAPLIKKMTTNSTYKIILNSNSG